MIRQQEGFFFFMHQRSRPPSKQTQSCTPNIIWNKSQSRSGRSCLHQRAPSLAANASLIDGSGHWQVNLRERRALESRSILQSTTKSCPSLLHHPPLADFLLATKDSRIKRQTAQIAYNPSPLLREISDTITQTASAFEAITRQMDYSFHEFPDPSDATKQLVQEEDLTSIDSK
jgi:hypothetical protein